MAAQRGRDILLKIIDTGTGSFVTVAGLRTRRITFNQQSVDITDSESAGRWRELFGGAGVRRCGVTGSGIFKDAASDETVCAHFFDGSAFDCQLVMPDFGTIEGPFVLTALEYAGNHDGEVTFEAALESAGELTFGAA